jgi:hypothetical protein
MPIGIVGTVWSYAKLKELGTRRGQKIDWLGNVTFASGLFILLAGITFTSSGIISSNSILFYLTIVGGLSLLVLFVFIEKYISKDYLCFIFLYLKSICRRQYRNSSQFYSKGRFYPDYGFLFTRSIYEIKPLEAGIYLIPVSGALVICGLISGWLSYRYGSEWFIQNISPLSLTYSILLYLYHLMFQDVFPLNVSRQI